MNKIKTYTLLLQAGLLVSGLTAFFIPDGVKLVANSSIVAIYPPLQQWLSFVEQGVMQTHHSYPFLWYGTDWMAFAHILFTILFYGLYKDPVRNLWLIRFGFIASLLIFPLAMIMGEIRHIPVIWRLADCMFGVIASLLLWRIHFLVKRLPDYYQYQVLTN